MPEVAEEVAAETAAEVAASLDAVRTPVVAIVLDIKYEDRIAAMIARATRSTKYFINTFMARWLYIENHRIRTYSQSSKIRN